VVATVASERRLQRLASVLPADHRITYGCINVPVGFFETVLAPLFRHSSGVVYVLPETRAAREVFGSYDLPPAVAVAVAAAPPRLAPLDQENPMNPIRIASPAAALAATLLVAVPTWAADPAKPSQAQIDYRQERARCLRGDTHQDRATCLKEAGAAYEEARRGALASPKDADLSRNATQRCEAQPPADRDACVQRILGAGAAEGSVEGGGVIRSTETPK
jgi:hypothetical protein